MPYEPKDATPATVRVNREAVALYDMDDRQDFADADRGFIAGFPDGKVLGPDGHAQYSFGGLLDLNAQGMITCGIGIASTHGPSISYISPTDALDGDRSVLDAFARLIDEFDPNFNIVTP